MSEAGRYVYTYPRPMVTADAVVFAGPADKASAVDTQASSVLLIKRRHDPYAGRWALPGGFLDENEPPHVAAARELAEETGLIGLDLRELGVFGAPGRDPRGWNISVVYWTMLGDPAAAKNLRHGDDAAAAAWFPLDQLPDLAFDHREIIDRARAAAGI